MITVRIEINGDRESRLVVVRAGSIEQAVRSTKEEYAGCDVRVVFPLDPESFFAREADAGASLMVSEGLGT